MRIFIHIFIFILCIPEVAGQELPLNSQIFLNPYYYNPAFAGFEDRPAFYVYRRQQWTGIEGAPTTTGVNFHTIFNEKINFGVYIANDERSILKTSRGLITFGYRASFDEFHYISFALSGGLGFNSIDLESADLIDPDDPAIIDALDNNLFLEGNAGFNYYNNGFNLGLSLPKIFRTNTLSNSSFAPGEISPLNDAILMSSYKWELSEGRFALEPYIIYYYTKDLPGQFEAIGMLHLMDVFWIGASYRQDYGTTGFVGLNISDNFKFGYAYEFFDAQPATFNNGTHDIQLALIFGEKKKKGKVNLIQKRRNMLRSMGKLPSKQKQNIYQVEKDPFVPPKTEPETYNEEDALQDLLDEMEVESVQEDTVSFEELEQPVEEDTIDIFNIRFDDEPVGEPVPEATPVGTPVAAAKAKPREVDEEAELIRQMEEEAVEEITFEAPEELTETTAPDQDLATEDLTEEIEAEKEEFIEPALDDKGFYIGPTTVVKGDHLLELEKGNYVVVGTFSTYRDAEEYSDQLFIKGFYTKFGYISQTKIYYVYIFESDDLQETKDTSERFNMIGAQLRENWVLQVQ
ncbi:MAG: PorP/SprF family type IX secretion system membrane protein [Cytophagales bacterium]|nr:PorP/SprF family type IX secretion system membrane protein [Cytophagales bacterium]